MGDNAELQNILKKLKSHEPFERKQAVKELEKLGDKSILKMLCDILLNDPASVVRHSVAHAFQKSLADKSSVPSLIQASRDSDIFVRSAVVSALGSIKDKTAVPVVCLALQDENATVRWAAAISLGKIGDVLAIPALKKLINNKNEQNNVITAAKDALRQLEN